MLNTFDALAKFPSDENTETDNDTHQQNDTNASVDMSAIINRLNEMETKINELVNKATDFPTRGKNDNDNPAPDNNGANNSDPAPNNGADDNKGE